MAQFVKPVDRVATAIESRIPRRAVDDEMDFASRQMQIFRDLTAGLARADNHDIAGGAIAAGDDMRKNEAAYMMA